MTYSDYISSVGCATDKANSDQINLIGYDGGHFQVVSGSVTTITWFASVDGTTYKAVKDADGNALTQTVDTSSDFVLPPTLNGRRYVKAQGDASGVLLVGRKTMATQP